MKILFLEMNRDESAIPWWYSYVKSCLKERDIVLDIVNVVDDVKMSNLIKLSKLLIKSKRYDWVITNQDGLATFWFGVLRSILGIKRPKHAILEFITRERDNSIYDRFKYKFLHFSLRRVNKIFCSTKNEVEYYKKNINLSENQMVYVPLAGDPKFLAERACDNDYILAAGRTMRDYKTLVEAVEGTNYRAIIVASPLNMKNIKLNQNIEVLYDIPQSRLVSLMGAARLIILPLQERQISCGQRVLLIAMSLGKCIIASKVYGTIDYITDGKDGILVEPHNPVLLRKKITEMWDADDLRKNIEENARRTFLSKHMVEHYAGAVFSSITS